MPQRKTATKKKKAKKPELNSHEKAFLSVLDGKYPYLAKLVNFEDAPYEGTGYRSDLVIPLPNHPFYVGVVIEIQGGTRQGWGTHKGNRTGHSTPDAIRRDNAKCVTAQLNKYFYMPVVTESPVYQTAAEILHQLYMFGIEL